jgi:hypothetical protein
VLNSSLFRTRAIRCSARIWSAVNTAHPRQTRTSSMPPGARAASALTARPSQPCSASAGGRGGGTGYQRELRRSCGLQASTARRSEGRSPVFLKGELLAVRRRLRATAARFSLNIAAILRVLRTSGIPDRRTTHFRVRLLAIQLMQCRAARRSFALNVQTCGFSGFSRHRSRGMAGTIAYQMRPFQNLGNCGTTLSTTRSPRCSGLHHG